MKCLHCFFIAALFATLLGTSENAAAQTMENLKACQNITGDPDSVIQGCSVFIDTGRTVGGRGALPAIAHSSIYSLRAGAYVRLMKYDLALADLDHALRINAPASARATAYTIRGELRSNYLRDVDGGASDLDQAIRISPKFVPALQTRSALYILQGDDEHADILQKRAVQADPQQQQKIETSLGLTRHWMRYLKEIQEDGDYANWSGPPLDSVRGTSVASLEAAKATASPATKETAAPSKDPAASDTCALAATHWQSTEAIGTRAAYEDHLTRFPNCTFAGLAKARLATLEKPSEPVSAPSRRSTPRAVRQTASRPAAPEAPPANDPIGNVVRSIPDPNVKNMINGVLRQNGMKTY